MSVSREEVESALLDYFRETDPGRTVQADTDLGRAGLLDSLAALQIQSFIERKFKVEVPETEVTLATLYSVNTIADLVMRCHSKSPA